MATKLQIRQTTDPEPDTDQLRAILSGDATETSAPRSQFRLDDIRDWWNGTEQQLSHALIRLVENGEIAIFPLGDVTKVRLE